MDLIENRENMLKNKIDYFGCVLRIRSLRALDSIRESGHKRDTFIKGDLVRRGYILECLIIKPPTFYF